MLTYKQWLSESDSYEDLLAIMQGKKTVKFNKMYHFSLKDKVDDILSQGLKAKKGSSSSSYSKEKRVYLFPKEAVDNKEIKYWVNERFNKKDDYPEVSLLEIDTTDLVIYKAMLDEYYVKEDISKDRISVAKDNFEY